jgi:hypothetical protein
VIKAYLGEEDKTYSRLDAWKSSNFSGEW